MTEIKIQNITNSSRAVSASDGEKIFDIIKQNFDQNLPVVLDFEGISLTITAFLNSSIGKLYSIYDVNKIKTLLKIVNLNQDEVELLKFVIEKAKLRFGKLDDENDLIDEA